MPLYSDEELKNFPQFESVEEALKDPEKVIRFRAYRLEDADALERVAELGNLQSLSISLSDVSKLLPRLGTLPMLQSLSLQACRIAAFPENILNLQHLRSLVMGNNALTEVPDEICRLTGLESLSFGQNSIRKIPGCVGELTRLKTLGFDYNEIEEVPDTIGSLKELQWLFLEVNNLKELPPEIGGLIQLQGLHLNFNKLRTLPDSICQLAALESLSLENNPFVSLPACLAQMDGIKRLAIEAEKRVLFMDWSYPVTEMPPQKELSDLKLGVTQDSVLHDPLLKEVRECGFLQASEYFLAAARDAVKIESTTPDDYSQPGSSRLGGFPDLPDSSWFPKTEGLYWMFLAQFDLAELALYNSYLPRTGTLFFFVDSTESLNAKVLFHEGEKESLTTIRHDGADEMFSPDDDHTQAPHRVSFRRFFSLPSSLPEGLFDDQTRDNYVMNCDSLRQPVDHHINGYTFTQHESPQEQAANKLRGKPEEWVPLLQLGWDSNVGFCFWDAGTLTFCIHQEDLRRHDFSNVHVSLESS